MKKIMVMLAAVAAAVVAQASSFDWQVATGSDYASMNVYCFKNTTAETIIAAFSATDDANKWTDAVKGISPVTAGTGARGVASSGVVDVKTGDNLVFAIVDGDIKEGSSWYVLSDYTITSGTYDPPTTGTKIKIAVGTPTSGTFTIKAGPGPGPGPEPVPEPTSGLLLVLGGAALALRRKQK